MCLASSDGMSQSTTDRFCLFCAASPVGLMRCAGTSVLRFLRMSVAYMRVSSDGGLLTTGKQCGPLLAEGAMTAAYAS